ncbi:Abca3 [Symbiodinium microadriaticum]|nr:Abca3 [Symbiodinium microadriaticum]
MAAIDPQDDPSFNEDQLSGLDEDVLQERADALDPAVAGESPLRIERLRKVFPPKRAGGSSVVAAQDVCLHVREGEIFGLLGANGAGKTTTLSMLTRHLIPTSGNAFVAGRSVLNDFKRAGTHLGVVTQNNSLWDLLSVQDHLKLFARLRGVPEDIVYQVVDDTIDQLELTPHRAKLAGRLSGGMKRKLCVAIALIGDPEVVLLDEPSAGLDPVSRRNLWNVILRTMSHRAVVLTTHSMEEAEALCKRIGIMVLGQVRVLGTKQHLKSKFGSGYELVVKLKTSELGTSLDNLSKFVTDMFPTAKFISDNGGLVTYSIPQTEMNMGLAFTEFEAKKDQLLVEDYSIAQSTLEQVFIRTVQAHTPASKLRLSSVEHHTACRSSSRQRLEDDLAGQGENVEDAVNPIEEAFVVLNTCGCTPKFVKISTAVTLFAFLLFLAVSIAARVPSLLAVAVVFLIAFLICCVLCCCPCFQAPKDDED